MSRTDPALNPLVVPVAEVENCARCIEDGKKPHRRGPWTLADHRIVHLILHREDDPFAPPPGADERRGGDG